jgi:hypothetical protein
MNGEVTDYVAGQWLKIFTPAWFSLHTSNPAVDGFAESEVVGGSYARQSGAWTVQSARGIWLATKLVWLGLPATRLTHVGVWNLPYNGQLLSFNELPAPGHDVAQGASFQLDPYTYAISIGIAA